MGSPDTAAVTNTNKRLFSLTVLGGGSFYLFIVDFYFLGFLEKNSLQMRC